MVAPRPLPAGRPYRGRFAPSPTGFLHLGNARTALLAWLRARSHGGELVLRVEDLDGPRTRPEAVEGNLEELRWLGIDWDEGPDVGGPRGPYLQSLRGERYSAALERLREGGRLFACYLSRKDLAEAASAPHGEGAARHGGTAERAYGEAERARSAAKAAARAAAGVAPSWRFAVPDEVVSFVDACAGRVLIDLRRQVGHFVVRRSDGLWAYQLAVVVDDAAMGITEVVRGADLLTSSGAQLALYAALGYEPPAFAHVGVVLDEHGERLAKRSGAATLRDLRGAGVRPERVVGLLAHTLGMTDHPEEASAAEVLAGFAAARHGCAGARLTGELWSWLLAP